MRRPRGTRGRHTTSRILAPYDDVHTCTECFGPISYGRCLFCHAVAGPKVVVELEDGSTATEPLVALLQRRRVR